MLGLLFGFIFLGLGLYLTGSCLWHKLRCTHFVAAQVALGNQQDKISAKGTREKNKFPEYTFSVHGQSYHVIDYNAPRGIPLVPGDLVQVFCDPACPGKRWYLAGSLWRDGLWGVLSLLAAAFIGMLFFI